ncbi:cysteine hydrolase family protein [Nocardia sp. CA-129566]|uniref:cysteine hydrolase family protein n=1 Tax=Nocardia sp. CA-129566 TaxID=3239976 RepID=UPI003D97C91A
MNAPAPKRALIVVDVQNEYVTGDLRIQYPPVEDSLTQIGRAMDTAAAAGMPIVVVQHTAPTGAPIFDRGTAGWQLHRTVAERHYDLALEKTVPSVFAENDLESWLRERGIDTIAVVGYMTHHCNNALITHAHHAGFGTEHLSDATGTVPLTNAAGQATAAEIHRVLNVVMHSQFAAVSTTEQWVHNVGNATATPIGNLYDSYNSSFASAAPR